MLPTILLEAGLIMGFFFNSLSLNTPTLTLPPISPASCAQFTAASSSRSARTSCTSRQHPPSSSLSSSQMNPCRSISCSEQHLTCSLAACSGTTLLRQCCFSPHLTPTASSFLSSMSSPRRAAFSSLGWITSLRTLQSTSPSHPQYYSSAESCPLQEIWARGTLTSSLFRAYLYSDLDWTFWGSRNQSPGSTRRGDSHKWVPIRSPLCYPALKLFIINSYTPIIGSLSGLEQGILSLALVLLLAPGIWGWRLWVKWRLRLLHVTWLLLGLLSLVPIHHCRLLNVHLHT